eukprot:10530922-Prorocentrum_lima.AAC.1
MSAAYCEHARKCAIGGGPLYRHNLCRDALAGWLKEGHGNAAVLTEQHVPQWDRDTTKGTQQAVLD